MRRHWLHLLVLLWIAPAANAQATKALDIVPEDALGFIVVKNLHQLSEKVETLAKKVKAPAHTSFLEQIQKMGPHKGLNAKGSVVMIALKGQTDNEPLSVVVALPVADYVALVKELGVKDESEKIMRGYLAVPKVFAGLGDVPDTEKKDPLKYPVFMARKKDYLLIANMDAGSKQAPTEADRKALRHVLDASKSVAESVQQAESWLGEMDVAGVVSRHGIEFGLGMVAAGVGTSSPEQLGALKTFYADAKKNVTVLAFGALIADEGDWRLSSRVYFRPEGEFAKWMAKAEPLQAKLLSRFAAERYLAAGSVRFSEQVGLEALAKRLSSKELTESLLPLLRRISEASVCVHQNPSLGGALIAKVEDASAFLKRAEELIKKSPEIARIFEADIQPAGKNEVKFQHRQIAGKQTVIVSVSTGANAKTNGRAGLLAALDEKTVLATWLDAGKTDGAEAILRQYAKQPAQTLAADPFLLKTESMLPPQKQVVVYLNMQTVLASMAGIKLKDCPPLGFAMRTLPAGVEAQFLVPYDMILSFFQSVDLGKSAQKSIGSNNLKQIGLAMHNHHDAYNKFPAAAICDKNGEPLLSWRVAILPFIEQQALYHQFKLDEPWDSTHNKKLIAKMPKIYAIPGTPASEGTTHYRVFVGDGSGFELSKGLQTLDVTDGTSNTIMVVEAAQGVPWTKPDPLVYDAKKPLPKFGDFYGNGTFPAAFFDGSVHTLNRNLNEATLRAMITRGAADVIGKDFDFNKARKDK